MEKIYYIPTDKKIMCLTFDDGPNDPVTPIILDILGKRGIKATFFVLMENVSRHPDILRRIVQDGHTVGLHGQSHKSFRKHPKLTVYRHIKKSMDALREQFGVTPKYFRPPYGTLTPDSETICGEFNLTPVGWTIMEKDWQPSGAARKSACMLKKCSPGKILVLHDGYRNFEHEGTTVANLQDILPPLLQEGYRFVSIPELVASKSFSRHPIVSDIPLLHREIIDYECHNQTTVFFYWDVNFIGKTEDCTCPMCGSKVDRHLLEMKMVGNGKITNVVVKLPNPSAMEEWHQGIEFPLNFVPQNAEMFIKNSEGIFAQI